MIGVFLDSNVSSGNAPDSLSSTDYLTLSPLLNQIFFIGDGKNNLNTQQQVFVPDGATRLLLGTADGFGWNNNTGSITATVSGFQNTTAAPEPGTLTLLVAGGMMGVGLMLLRHRIATR